MKMTLTNFRYNGKHKEQKSWQEISYPLVEDVHAVTWARRKIIGMDSIMSQRISTI
jgi:hypothetical protein